MKKYDPRIPEVRLADTDMILSGGWFLLLVKMWAGVAVGVNQTGIQGPLLTFT